MNMNFLTWLLMTRKKIFFAYFVRRGAPASPTFASARTWLEGEFLKIYWTYAYRIHTYMESSEKFHISMKWSILIWNSYSYGQQQQKWMTHCRRLADQSTNWHVQLVDWHEWPTGNTASGRIPTLTASVPTGHPVGRSVNFPHRA